MTKETEEIKQVKSEIEDYEENNVQNNEQACKINKKDDDYCPIGTEPLPLKTIAQIVYACEALSYFFGITAIVGIIINYLRRDEAKDTWLESHFTWQIRTFWIGLGVAIVGCVLTVILIGFLILAPNLVWMIFRVVKGWLLLQENKPVPNCTGLL